MVPAVDDSQWPLVRVLYPAAATIDEIRLFVGLLERAVRSGPVAVLSDTRALDPLQATTLHRRIVADAVDKLSKAGAILCAANIVNARTRPLLQAVHWERMHHLHPIGIFDDPDEAERWARGFLREDRRREEPKAS